MVDEDELRRMTPQERLQLRRALAALDDQDVRASRPRDRRRAIILAVIIICCIGLAAWIGVLAATLPRYYRAGGWRGAWVGFDLAVLAAFAVTGWAAWRRRQILIICLVVLATLLCCDAWFDVVLDARTNGFQAEPAVGAADRAAAGRARDPRRAAPAADDQRRHAPVPGGVPGRCPGCARSRWSASSPAARSATCWPSRRRSCRRSQTPNAGRRLRVDSGRR